MLDSGTASPAADQAAGLRKIVPAALRILPLTCAGRGFGYTSCVTNIAAAIAACGSRVVIIDAGRTLAAAALGLRAKFELMHLLTGEKSFQETVLVTPEFSVLPAAKGLDEFIQSGSSVDDLFGAFAQLPQPADLLLLAASPQSIASLLPSDSEVLLVLTDAAEAVKATYAQIKKMTQEHGFHRYLILLNNVENERRAHDVYARLADTAQRFLHAELALAGIIPGDPAVQRASASCAHVFRGQAGPARAAFSRLALEVSHWRLAEFSRVNH